MVLVLSNTCHQCSSLSWCRLRFPRINNGQFIFTPISYAMCSCFMCALCIYLRLLVSNTDFISNYVHVIWKDHDGCQYWSMKCWSFLCFQVHSWLFVGSVLLNLLLFVIFVDRFVCTSVLVLLTIVLLVFLRFTADDYPFGIFKHCLAKHFTRCCKVFYNRIKKRNFCNIKTGMNLVDLCFKWKSIHLSCTCITYRLIFFFKSSSLICI